MDNVQKNEKQRNSSFHHIIPTQASTNYMESFMHLFKGSIGVGLFAMGDAFKHGGIYVAPVVTLVMAIICIHCQHLLLSSAKTASLLRGDGEKRFDYAEAVELCFSEGPQRLALTSEKMGTVCNYFIAITQIGFCCVYVTFIATNVEQIFLTNGIKINTHIIIVIIWVPIWVFCMITQLKSLAPVSLMANLLILGSFFITIYFAVKDGFPNLNERRPYTELHHTMLCFGTVIFSYEGIALLLPIKNAMKKPDDFDKPLGVLNTGMCVVVMLYMTGGICGYMKWGEEVDGTMTSNLGESILAQCTKALVSVGILLTYPLQFYVPITTMLPTVLKKFKCVKNTLLCELIFRSLVAISTLAIAEAFPKVGIFISLIGGLCSTVLALVFPPVMECLLLKHTTKNSKCLLSFKIFKNCVILIIALFTFFVGTYVSIVEIVHYFKHEFGHEKV